jgi:hypothetical protein
MGASPPIKTYSQRNLSRRLTSWVIHNLPYQQHKIKLVKFQKLIGPTPIYNLENGE